MPKMRVADKRIQRAYHRSCSGIQIGIFDLSKVLAVGQDAIRRDPEITDIELEGKIRDFVETIRKN